ncbi:response regulator [Alteromonas sp. ASW11-36]|uniref:Response regulator n=1 Tax=Alteromonas arenosi TaxID=3055817 RepID=A0ABT7SW22_9ALTE|nr:response regulator [Alteromonas sp. ASW11-36]MDM7860371.1 response regulator [Alteromonas sp. ASW11-36]
MKILFVDDDPLIVELFEMDLKYHYADCVISTATNGIEAVDLCMKVNFDLIFTDGKMPKMDGIELINRLNELQYGADIVLVTGYHKLVDEINSEKMGITKILYKPIKFEELHACVDAVKK